MTATAIKGSVLRNTGTRGFSPVTGSTTIKRLPHTHTLTHPFVFLLRAHVTRQCSTQPPTAVYSGHHNYLMTKLLVSPPCSCTHDLSVNNSAERARNSGPLKQQVQSKWESCFSIFTVVHPLLTLGSSAGLFAYLHHAVSSDRSSINPSVRSFISHADVRAPQVRRWSHRPLSIRPPWRSLTGN